MDVDKQEVAAYVIEILNQLASDWEFDQEITRDSYLFTDLGFQSLDAVVLGNALQEKFGKPIPYADLLEDVGKREQNDVAVEEWIDFTYRHLSNSSSGIQS